MTRKRTALVTGANRGLGLETCRQLASKGLRVVLTSRGRDDGMAAAQKLAREHPEVQYHQLDVTDRASIAALADNLGRDKISVDVLINNAGIYPRHLSEDIVRQTIEVNVYGPMRITDALVPCVPEGGSIVMVSSGLGELAGYSPELRDRFLDPSLNRDKLSSLMTAFADAVAHGRYAEEGWPGSAYNVSKAALNALVRILAKELRRRARVNAVSPGWARTDMGGEAAPRSVEQGAASIVTTALADDGVTGGNFQDGKPRPW